MRVRFSLTAPFIIRRKQWRNLLPRFDHHKNLLALENFLRRTNNQKEIDMSIELKIKSKHLSLEAKVIRFEEAKVIKQLKWLHKNKPKEVYYKELELVSLSNHRKYVVGIENRATFLARAYIAGTPYNKVECKRRDDKAYEFNAMVIPRVYEMVKKYAPYQMRKDLTKEMIIDWCN